MKKSTIFVVLVLFIATLLFVNALPAQARDGHGHGGHHGGHSSFSGSVWIGPGWGGWDPWWGGWGPWGGGWGPGWGAPYYYGNYWQPPAVYQGESPAYVEPSPQAEEQTYWYFCPDSRNYYPYVRQCPNGWMKVVPPTAPSDYRE